MQRLTTAAVVFSTLASLLTGTTALADPQNLNRDLPLTIEDTTPVEEGGLELQASARYVRTDAHEDQFTLAPQIQYGGMPDWQFSATLPLIIGDADRTGSADLHARALWNFLKGDDSMPSLAAAAEIVLPSGYQNDGLDTALEFLATKGLGGGSNEDAQQRIHFNLIWERNAARQSDERENRFTAALGYSYELDSETVLLADLVRRQEREEKQDSTILELGAIRSLDEHVDASAGIGFGLGDDSPELQLTVGIQYAF